MAAAEPAHRKAATSRSPPSPSILVVEDNHDLAYGLKNNLEIEGYGVAVAPDGESALRAARTGTPDLVILDLMLPGMDGFRVLRALRGNGVDVPVLILTARGEEADKVRGLRLGADDYVTKPFGVLELLARVAAFLRRTRSDPQSAEQSVQRFGSVVVDAEARTVYRAGEPVTVTPQELDLLLALMARRGAVASRLELMREVWGYHDSVLSRTVDTHIAELRRKLEDVPAQPQHILTVHKVGYRFRTEPNSRRRS